MSSGQSFKPRRIYSDVGAREAREEVVTGIVWARPPDNTEATFGGGGGGGDLRLRHWHPMPASQQAFLAQVDTDDEEG